MFEQGFEAGELGGERRLLYTGGYVGAEESAVERLCAGANCLVGQAEARRTSDAIQFVVFDSATEGVEDAVLDVALNLEGIEVVSALDFLIACGCEEPAAFVFVVKAKQNGDAVGEGVIGLVGEFVAIGDRVVGGEVELSLTGSGVAVGSAKGDSVAVVDGFGEAIEDDVDGLAGGSELVDLFALASNAVTGEIVPVPC